MQSSASLPSYVERVERYAKEEGMRKAKVNKAKKVKTFGEKVATEDYTSPFLTGWLKSSEHYQLDCPTILYTVDFGDPFLGLLSIIQISYV